MFAVGEDYLIKTIESIDGELRESGAVWTVVEVSGTLIKLHNGAGPDRILNTASPHFVSAERADAKTYQTPAAAEIDVDGPDDKL